MVGIFSIEDLKSKLQHILNMVKSELDIPGSNAGAYVLVLVFLKRMHDTKESDPSFWWNLVDFTIRNSSFSNGDIRTNCDQVLYDFQKSREIFEGLFDAINFKECDFMSSIYTIIYYLDNVGLKESVISEEMMGEVFNYLIKEIYYSRENGAYQSEIVKLMTKLTEPFLGDEIYDPNAGFGELLASIRDYANDNFERNSAVRYYGQVSDKIIQAICRMNLIMHGMYNVRIDIGDIIFNPGNIDIFEFELKKFNKIMTKLPTSKRRDGYLETYFRDIYGRFKYGYPPRRSSDYAVIQHIISSLDENGKAVILTADKVLSISGREQEIRRNIIEQDLVEAVIAIPEGTFQSTKGSSSILVLNKNKEVKRQGKIILIKIPYSKSISREENLDIEKVLEVYRNYVENEDVSKIVDLNDIRNNEYNINYKRYDDVFKENQLMLEDGKGKRLKDILEDVFGEVQYRNTIEGDNGIPYIRIRDLNDSIREKDLMVDAGERRVPIRPAKILNRKAIVIAILGDKLKPTMFDPNISHCKELLVGQSVLALLPNEQIVDIEYLYYQLYSPRVLYQLEQLRTGLIPRIKKSDLLDIVIPVPALSTQIDYTREQRLPLLEIETLKKVEKARQLEMEKIGLEAQKEIIGKLSHNALPYIYYIKSNMDILRQLVIDNSLMEKCYQNDEVGDDEDSDLLLESISLPKETIRTVFNRVDVYLKTIEEYIDRTNKVIKLQLDKNDFEPINLSEFLEDLTSIKRAEVLGKYNIVIDCAKNITLSLHKISFQEVFNQIFRNAEMHAFDFSNKKNNYQVKIKVQENDEKVIIVYTNNGKFFELSKDSYIAPLKKGKDSHGQGLGGAYINSVIEAHGGTLEIVNKEKGMELQIIIPKKGERKGA